jgi:hypothetical protein
MRWPWKEFAHEVPRSYVATPWLGGRFSDRRQGLSDRRGSDAARDRALPIQHPPRVRRTFRGRHLRARDGPPARPARQPGNVPGLLHLTRGDGGDHGRPERNRGFIGDFDLGGPRHPLYELVASTQPCAMCLGATPWSGVRHLVCGARDEDAEEIGFDEGMKPADWIRSLEERGITVEEGYSPRRGRLRAPGVRRGRRDLQRPPERVTL